MRSLRHSFYVSLGAHALVFGAVLAAGWAWHEARLPDSSFGAPNVLTVLGLPEEPAPQAASAPASPLAPAVAAVPPLPPPPPVSAPPPIPPPVLATVTPPAPDPLPMREPEVDVKPTPLAPEVSATQPAAAAASSPTLQAVAPAGAPVAVPEPAAAAGGTGTGAMASASGGSVARPTAGETSARPDYRRNPEPAYPLAARRRGQEGLVLLRVMVSIKGRAARVELKQSSGYALLDEAAIRAVREWEFEPARLGPLSVESEIEVPVRFRIAR